MVITVLFGVGVVRISSSDKRKLNLGYGFMPTEDYSMMMLFRDSNDTWFTARRRKVWFLTSILLIVQYFLIGTFANLIAVNADISFLKYLGLVGVACLGCLAICSVFLAIAKTISLYEMLLYWITLIVMVGGLGYAVLSHLRDVALHHPHY